jgi:hypothetical protein
VQLFASAACFQGRAASLCMRRELTEDDQTLSPFQQGKQDARAAPLGSSVEEEKRDLECWRDAEVAKKS